MMKLSDLFGGFAGDVLHAGAGALAQSIRVSVKTNLGPEFQVAAPGQARGPGFLDALGVRGAVIVRDADGRVLYQYGEPPPTNPLLLVVVLATVALLGFALVRGFIKR